MNPTRQTKLDDLETLRQSQVRLDNMPRNMQVQEKLSHLLAFLRQMADTPHGRRELERRKNEFGVCAYVAGQSQQEFYGQLRLWLDRDLTGLSLPPGHSRDSNRRSAHSR